MSVGNGCVKIEYNNEVNYANRFEMCWNYFDIKEQKKKRRPIYLYAFFNPSLANDAKEALIAEVAELNSIYDEYKQKLTKAKAQHKKNPEMPKLTESQEKLVKKVLLSLTPRLTVMISVMKRLINTSSQQVSGC